MLHGNQSGLLDECCCKTQWPDMLPNTVAGKMGIGCCLVLAPRLLTQGNLGCFADIKHMSLCVESPGGALWAHLDAHPRHREDKADMIGTCETEALGK